MEPTIPQPKLEPGVYQGNPEAVREKTEGSFPLRPIRTMKNDMAEAIKQQNETSVSIAIAEEKKKAEARAAAQAASQTQTEDTTPAPKRIGRIVVVIIVLLLVALLGVAYVFLLPKLSSIQLPKIPLPSFEKPSNTSVAPSAPAAEPLAQSIIPAQSEKRFNISAETLSQTTSAITLERGKGNPSRSIKNLYFTETEGDISAEISSSRLFSFANAQAPDILTRSLEKQFMTGFFGEENGGVTPFLILKVSDHDMGLAGMLEWEPQISKFFDTIFGTNAEALPGTKFKDIIVLEKNARLFETASGAKIVYSFANQNTIVIAGSRSALEALMALARTPMSASL